MVWLFATVIFFSVAFFPVIGTNQAILVIPDQVIPPSPQQRLFYKRVVLRPGILQQRALHGTLLIAFGNVDLPHGERVQASMVHTG